MHTTGLYILTNLKIHLVYNWSKLSNTLNAPHRCPQKTAYSIHKRLDDIQALPQKFALLTSDKGHHSTHANQLSLKLQEKSPQQFEGITTMSAVRTL